MKMTKKSIDIVMRKLDKEIEKIVFDEKMLDPRFAAKVRRKYKKEIEFIDLAFRILSSISNSR